MNKREEKDCWNCGVAEEMRLSGSEKSCIFAEQMMRNPCCGWKSLSCIGDGVEEALARISNAK